MNKKLIHILTATIPLVFFAQACTTTPETPANSNQTGNNTKVDSKTPEKTPTSTDNKSTANPKSEKTTTPAAVKENPEKSAKLTNMAKFLAGIKVDANTPLAAEQKTQAWKVYADYFDNSWKDLDKKQLAKIRTWSEQELKSINETPHPIFYPFSGPDFLYAYSFFPNGTNYIMAGLEPVGSIPEIEKKSDGEIDRKLQGIQNSLNAILNYSFFRTNDMKVDLSEKGVVPILLVFLARTNNKILDLQYIQLKKDGTIQVADKGNKEKLIPGVKIDFVPAGKTEPRTIYYFSGDLSDDGLKKTPEYIKFVQGFDKRITYLKAASYLMHNEEFSKIRNLITSESAALLQDDSGIPLKFFDAKKWNLNFYGNYTQPIALFSARYQPDLRKAYQGTKDIKPLNFGIGYQYEVNASNLMLGTHK